jgi:heme/copper-type cytochrome/quinol oxidase subunit 2
MHHFIHLAEDAAAASDFPVPTWVMGAIAMTIFILLGVVTWSYRDVANRHDHKSSSNHDHH